MVQSVSGIPAQVDYGFGNLVSPIRRTTRGGESRAEEERASRSQASELTAEQQRQVSQLQATDRQVRAHEQAHVAAGGDLVRGSATFTYATGPDDKRYAVAGEVSIDTSPGRTPQETIPKAQHIRETALAPADPSPQDRSVAAKAVQMEGDARRELAALRASDAEGKRTNDGAEGYLGVDNHHLTRLGAAVDVFA